MSLPRSYSDRLVADAATDATIALTAALVLLLRTDDPPSDAAIDALTELIIQCGRTALRARRGLRPARKRKPRLEDNPLFRARMREADRLQAATPALTDPELASQLGGMSLRTFRYWRAKWRRLPDH